MPIPNTETIGKNDWTRKGFAERVGKREEVAAPFAASFATFLASGAW